MNNFWRQYGKLVKYGGLFINIVLMLATIRIYLHYQSIIKTTHKAEETTQHMVQQEAYRKNFHQRYIKSIYAPYFKGHENNNIYPKEFLVEFTTKTPHTNNKETLSSKKEKINGKQENTLSPSQQRNILIKKKIMH